MMKARSRFLAWMAVILVIALAGWLVFPKSTPEPSYDGQTLSKWLEMSAAESDAGRVEAEKAVRAIGTKAIPFLLELIRYEPVQGKEELLPNQFSDRMWNDEKDDLAALACVGFRILGAEAEPAIPELCRIMNAPAADHSSPRAMCALHDIGPKAFLPVVFALTNQPWIVLKYGVNDPDWMRRCATSLGTNTRPALPVLLETLNHGNNWVSSRAAMILCSLKLEPGLVAQSVQPSLQHSNPRVRALAASILEVLRHQPDPEIEMALLVFTDPEASITVREHASNELSRLAPQAMSNVLRAVNLPNP